MSSDIKPLKSELESLRGLWLGKTYPVHDVPFELKRIRQLALEIPLSMRAALLPSLELDVTSFLARSWPKSTSFLISFKPAKCYCKTSPIESGTCLRTRDLPSKDFVNGALACLGQALLDGASSFIDPSYKGGTLPLWCIQYWEEAHKVADVRVMWSRAVSWLEKNSNNATGDQTVMIQSREALNSLLWNEITKVRSAATNTRTAQFAGILSDKMMTTMMVDILVNIIMDIVHSDEALSGAFEVVDLVFMYDIQKADAPETYKTGHAHTCTSLRRSYEEAIRFCFSQSIWKHDCTSLALKSISSGEQLLTVRVADSLDENVMAHMYSAGDSLPATEPSVAFKKLQWWLSARFEGNFKSMGCSLSHGNQEDEHSCFMLWLHITNW